MLQAGAAVFVLGSLLAGLAPTIAALIAGRVLAGVAALLLPASLALIRVIWADPHERAHAIGVWAGTNGAALAIGPTLGGWLIQVAGWHMGPFASTLTALGATAPEGDRRGGTQKSAPDSTARESRHSVRRRTH